MKVKTNSKNPQKSHALTLDFTATTHKNKSWHQTDGRIKLHLCHTTSKGDLFFFFFYNLSLYKMKLICVLGGFDTIFGRNFVVERNRHKLIHPRIRHP